MTPVTIDSIRAAHARIKDTIYRSPCTYSLALSRLCDAEIFCKLDHLQMTGSFKERGARNKLLQLSAEQQCRGVIAASAGNHALALAYHGSLLSVPVTVVMPKWAPLVKVANCRSLGANVILFGDSYDEAKHQATALGEERGLTIVSGFDDPDIIAGQGTLALEVLQDVPDADAIIVPVGGGGLIAGVAVAVKALRPATRIIGVEPTNAPTLHESLKRGEATKVPTRPTLADGLAVAQMGELCFELIRPALDDLVMVDEPQIAQAMLRLLELEKMVVEGAGAVTLAAAQIRKSDLAGKKVVLCLTGGNVDVTMISKVIDRGLAADGRLCRITAFAGDRPGSLAHLTRVLADTGANVLEVAHDRHFSPADVLVVGIT
ncbi:MAG TPA: threonine ammonia-lyase, partial [Tepidisphaeraceae bacterium]|nr:threonine ammonia-lyase [Tepidisphaeraceae bacterium]